MTRGRKRSHDKTIPAHIDQKKLPNGCYWNRRDRYWFLRTGERRKRIRIADAEALMSDLHRAMEAARGVQRDTLDWLFGKYVASAKYKALGERTKDDYEYSRKALQKHPTKVGIPFAELPLSSITLPLVQLLVDQIAEEFPSKANHVKRFISVAYSWGATRGHCTGNPATGVAEAKEKADHRMPEQETMQNVFTFLRLRGELPSRRKGSVAPYIWAVAYIAYRCRMRSVEVRDLNDESATEVGIMVRRRKKSRDNIVRWDTELRAAWDWLIARRAAIWGKKKTPIPLRARSRPLVISEDGVALSKSALNSGWRRAMANAIAAGELDTEERFGLHGLKHRGVTDTTGSRADKKEASGHKTDQMLDLYDHEISVVNPASRVDKTTASS